MVDEEESSIIPQRRWDGENKTGIAPGDELKVTNINGIRAMKEHSIATAYNTNFGLLEDSSGGARMTRNESSGKGKQTSGELFSWESFEGEVPHKTQNKRVNSNFDSSAKGHNDQTKTIKEVPTSMFGQG